MLELPTRGAAVRVPVESRAWAPEPYARLRDAHRDVPPCQLAAALLLILAERYGAPYRIGSTDGAEALGGSGSLEAARQALAATEGRLSWTALLELLAAPAPAAPAPPSSDAPLLVVGPATAEPPRGDLGLLTAPDASVRIHWNPDAYPAGTVELIARHLERIAAQVAAEPRRLLAELDLLTPEEAALNGADPAVLPEYPATTLHELFAQQAARTPESVALRFRDDELTYRQLDQAANRLAHRLLAAGVTTGQPVAVSGERSLGLFTALLAVLKAGGAILYLDPALPVARLAQFVDSGGPAALLHGPGGAPLELGLPVLEFPAVPDPQESGPGPAPHTGAGPQTPAYLLFTSGSTGVPKGVVRPHRMHTSRIFLEQGMYQLTAADRHLLKSPISFREFLWPLATGGTAIVAEPGGERDDEYLVGLIGRESISVVSFVPSMLRLLVAHPAFGELERLRHVFVGGEALPPDLEAQVRAHGLELHNTYTLTEADYVTHRRGPLDGPSGSHTVIGRPLDMRVYLCDRQGQRVPPGIVGEILVGGPGLATGYAGDPDRTAERFRPNPFGDPQAPVLFHTGDLAVHRPDGQLEYRGRADQQVKVRGHRVEPQEVEHLLREHPAVRDAAVVGYPDPQQGAVLVAFVVALDPAVTDHELRRALAERLPDFMIPRHFAQLPRLPQLLSGKVDRQALRPARRPRPRRATALVAPGTRTERLLTELWQRVLDADEVGIDDEYTALGGDSLRLLVLRAAIRDETGVAVDLAELLRRPTIRGQAALIDGTDPAAAGTTAGIGMVIDAGSRRPDPARSAAERDRRAALRGAARDQEAAR
ncbi:non-ribosomal peptide synthetase [Kitasatospora sp. GAS1066B]|uniref:non-ribosomal peptide synthetase n=1 Tax=Kitasatospora sp. GAS1066B TaxID=3156271 RepID=UPI0035128D4A